MTIHFPARIDHPTKSTNRMARRVPILYIQRGYPQTLPQAMKDSTTLYAPDDAGVSVQSLEFLKSAPGLALRQAVAELLGSKPEPSVSDVAGLRKAYSAPY